MSKLLISFRYLRKKPLLILLNVFSMALGLTAAGIIISYVYQEFHYDSENINSPRIYRAIQKDGKTQDAATYGPLSESLKSDYPEVEDASRVGFFYGYLACTAGEKKINERSAIFVDPEFFEVFSFPLIAGNSEDCLLSPNSIVISEEAANKYFDGDNPIGKTMQIGEKTEFVVSGVFKDFNAHSNFSGDLVIPLKQISKLTQIWIEPSWKYESDIHTFILLKRGVEIADFSDKARKFITKFIAESKTELFFQPLTDIHVNKQLPWDSKSRVNVRYLYVLLTVALFTLGISTANFLFLYIGIAEQRSMGTGMKKAWGASKTTLFLEHLREVMVLMMLSIIAAILIYGAYQTWLTRIFAFLPEIELLSFKLILILTSIAILVSLLSGIYPSIILSNMNPISLFNYKRVVMKGRFLLINLLVVFQFTICIALIIITLMMQKQTRYMLSLNPGYARDELVTIPLNMHVGEGIYNENFELFALELKKYPGIRNVSIAFSSPSSVISTGDTHVKWDGNFENREVMMSWESVSYDYFETMGVKIKQGRGFNRSYPDDQLSYDERRCSYIINESALNQMNLADPIGTQFEVWGFRGPIVGVVEDYNFRSLHSETGPIFYQMNPFYWNEIIVRINPSDLSVMSDIEKVWNKFASDFPFEINYVNNQIRSLYQNDQNLTNILNAFSLLSILIACMGLFTLTVMSISKRRKETSIRKVNGAKTHQILTMLNLDFIRWVVIAYMAAIPIAWYTIHKWLENFSYKTSLSLWIFVLAGLLAIGIAFLTVSLQSWQIASMNPVEALREE